MASEGLSARSLPDVPQLGGEVTRPGDEHVEVRGHGQRHAVPQVTGEHRLLRAGLDVPQHATTPRNRRRRRRRRRRDARLLEIVNRPRYSRSTVQLNSSQALVVSVTYQVQSPELVMISPSLMKRQQDR